MNAIHSSASKADLTVTRVLAQLLERLEHSAVPVEAAQYRSVVSRLQDELSRAPAGAALSALLEAHPAAAQVYENLQYEHAGLCRSPLQVSLNTEMQARDVIARAMRVTKRDSAAGPR